MPRISHSSRTTPPEPGPRLAASEAVLVGITGLNLCLEPWALGAMHLPSQLAGAVLASLGMVAALWPRRDLAAEDRPLRRLVRFPVFWAGLTLMAYMAIQACNPAWKFMSDGNTWWLDTLPHVAALPSGVEAPFARSNPWRSLLIVVTPWLIGCSLWSGLHRRLGYRRLFGAVAIGGAGLAMLGLAQRLSGTDRIFWSYRPANDAQFMASFIYRNHAGAYFDLALATAIGLCAWHGRRWRRRQESAGSAVGFGFAAALIGLGTVFSSSRMAIVIAAVPLASLSLGIFLGIRPDPGARPGWRILAAAVPLLCIAGLGTVALLSADIHQRFTALVHHPNDSLEIRRQARQAAEEMLADRWLFGWGAGCFRYGFPLYAQHHPEIYYAADHRIKYWEHAHDDLIEFPLELGLVGMIPIAVGAAFLFICGFQAGAARNLFAVCALGGCLGTLAHGWVDFVFQNPAVLTLWCTLAVGAARWPRLEASAGRRRERRGLSSAEPADHAQPAG